MMLDVEINYFG